MFVFVCVCGCPLQLQVSILADELSRKLQYLHVSSEGLTELQLLIIQLEVYMYMQCCVPWLYMKVKFYADL